MLVATAATRLLIRLVEPAAPVTGGLAMTLGTVAGGLIAIRSASPEHAADAAQARAAGD